MLAAFGIDDADEETDELRKKGDGLAQELKHRRPIQIASFEC